MKTGFKYLLIKALKLGITFLGIFLVIISVFIWFAANDKISPENLSSKNKLYISLRYRILTDLFRVDGPKYHCDTLPEFKFNFSDLEYKLINKQIKLSKTGEYKKYRSLNKWRKGVLKYQNEPYSMSWKFHGQTPTHHVKNGYFSLNIKLKENKLINNTKHFKLIIYPRLNQKVKVLEYIAKCFNLIIRKHHLVKVKFNNRDEYLYFFEHRFNNKYMRNNNHEELVKFSFNGEEDKSSIYDGFISISKLKDNIIYSLNKTNYSEQVKYKIIKNYTGLNHNIKNYNSDSILKFVELDYISNYLAARLITGCPTHGLYHSNFYMFYDTLSNKFYPCFARDEYVELLTKDSLEFNMHNYIWGKGNNVHPFKPYFNATLLKNDFVRQAQYRKAYDFITEKGNDFHYDLQKEYNKREKMHFPEWIKSCDGLTHLIAKPYFDTNATILKNYLSKSEPIINIKTTDSKISFDFKPQSNAALRFKSFTIKNTSNVKFECGSINLKITSYSTDEPKKVSSLNAKVNLNNGELNISNEMSKYFHCDGLDNNLLPFKRTYIYKIQLDTNFILNSSNIKIDYELVNIVTNQIVKL